MHKSILAKLAEERKKEEEEIIKVWSAKTRVKKTLLQCLKEKCQAWFIVADMYSCLVSDRVKSGTVHGLYRASLLVTSPNQNPL